MIQTRMLVLVGLMAVMFAGNAFAQRPFERIQRGWDEIRPRGRLLKEIFGEQDNQPAPQDRAQKERTAKKRAPNSQPYGRNGKARKASSRTSSRQPTLAENNDRKPIAKNSHQAPHTTPAKSHPSQLGLVVEPSKKDQGLIISHVKPAGAAQVAGLQRGDVIVSIGGIEVQSKEALESITEVLDGGVEIEFEIIRRGKKLNKAVQFGSLPEEFAELQPAPGNRDKRTSQNTFRPLSSASAATNTSRYRSAQPTIPQPSPTPSSGTRNHGMKSVLTPASQTRPRMNRQPRQQWQVTPPQPESIDNSQSPTPGRPLTRPLTKNNDPILSKLQRRLEQQQREIESLRKQLRQQKSRQSDDLPEITGLGLDWSG